VLRKLNVSNVTEALRPSVPVPVKVTAVAWLGDAVAPSRRRAPIDPPSSDLIAFLICISCPFDSMTTVETDPCGGR
jgi:hypothetical protein